MDEGVKLEEVKLELGPSTRYHSRGDQTMPGSGRQVTRDTLPMNESQSGSEGDELKADQDIEMGPVQRTKSVMSMKSMMSERTYAEPGDPRINVWSRQNRALPLSCLAVGLVMNFMGPSLTYYVIQELDVDPDQMSVLTILVGLPASLKVFFGLLTDCVPIMGQRRKPYILLGWLLFVCANLALSLMGRPNIQQLAALSFVMVFGYILAEVACEAIIVERSVLEPEARAGRMQGTGYIMRNFGQIVGSTFGIIIYNKDDWGWGLTISQIFLLNALAPMLLVLPWIWSLVDSKHFDGVRSLTKQFRDLWSMVTRRTVWRPMLFVAFYNMLQVPNAAWSNFLVIGLGFGPWQLGILGVTITIFSWLGITVYQLFLSHHSWRSIYVVTTLLGAAFSTLQLLLIFRINVKWGISDLLFSLGDDVMAAFNAAIQFLPTIIMYTRLCPHGAEGTAYAMLVTFYNVALGVSGNVGTLLTRVWDVSNESLYSGEWGGLWKLTLLTSLIQPFGLALLFLLPRNAEEQGMLQKSCTRSKAGGFFFVAFFVAALSWTIVQAFVILDV